ncbi:ImmA/IrrE family metallo-endopeptidase [Streptomyces sp. NPDC127178]
MSKRVDAFSHWYGNRPLVFRNPAKNDKARSRFDAAHEAGHLVMRLDAEPGSRIVENQAHDFAAEFLMPSAECRRTSGKPGHWRPRSAYGTRSTRATALRSWSRWLRSAAGEVFGLSP